MNLVHIAPAVALLVTALPLAAQQTRQMDAHVHGTGALQIAVEGTTVAMDITVPGADIVGFEHAPGSDTDRAAIAAALARFDDAFTLFTLQGDAGCTSVTTVNQTHGYGIPDEHDHDADAHDDHGHTDAASHDDHGHDDHDHAAEAANDGHDHDHGPEDHAAMAGHDDHDHDTAAGDSHAEFHAVYELTCDDPAAITAIAFPYFDRFANARELQVQIVSDTGAMSATVTRTSPVLSLAGAM